MTKLAKKSPTRNPVFVAKNDPDLMYLTIKALQTRYGFGFKTAKDIQTKAEDQVRAAGPTQWQRVVTQRRIFALAATLQTVEENYPGLLEKLSLSHAFSALSRKYRSPRRKGTLTPSRVHQISQALTELARLMRKTVGEIAQDAVNKKLPCTPGE